MSETKQIEDFATREFGGLLGEYGYHAEEPVRVDGKTRIDFVKDGIAVEVELDWREFFAFVLFVELKDGRLPGGYYVADGKPCRKHLARVIQEQGWKTPPGPRFERKKVRPSSAAHLNAVLVQYKEQLAACMSHVDAVGVSIFD